MSLEKLKWLFSVEDEGLKTLKEVVSAVGATTAAERLIGMGVGSATSFVAELLRLPGCWVPEIALNDARGWGDGYSADLAIIADTALPAFLCGLAVADTDLRGHVGYQATPSGGAAAQDWHGHLQPAETSPELLDWYDDGFAGALSRLQTLPPTQREIGEIPLPASVCSWWWAQRQARGARAEIPHEKEGP